MKAKVLLMGAIVAVSVISCSTERDEQTTEKPAEKLYLEELKINNPSGTENRIESDSIKPITPYSTPMNGLVGLDPDTGTDPNPDPNEGGDPKNVPIPPRR